METVYCLADFNIISVNLPKKHFPTSWGFSVIARSLLSLHLQEIEEQERRLKGEKAALARMESPAIVGSGVGLQWRKINDTRLMESMLTQVETLHNANSENMGKNRTGVLVDSKM